MTEVLIQTACMFAFAGMGAFGGYVAGCRRTTARNAAHVECLGCSHIGPDTALRDAQGAARAHHADTGHIAMVVSK